ncbi:MAG TPA: peptidylprolyl isomerase [Woeseiaceae bacterium]|jgi:parvulin-like peptidyl-prolyl isomerase
MKSQSFAFQLLSAVLTAALACAWTPSWAAEGDEVFARIGEVEITRSEFEREVYSAARQTFYHGQPPSGEEFVEFRREVADRMIDRQLLLLEAKRRELQPDHRSIDAKIANYEARYGDTERWQSEGPKMVAALRARFEADSLVDALEAEVRSVAAPGQEELREFYGANPDLFTEPAQNRVRVILLGVPPSADAAIWQAAREEAQLVMERLSDGDSFEELARQHSSDDSADKGGDMGYLHAGMLSPGAEEAIAQLEVGEFTEPVQVLEGMAIFQLADRRPEQMHEFLDVRDRAEELWKRQRGEQQWSGLVAELRSDSKVDVDTDYLASIPGYAQ